jgi:hypothetical protein
VAGDISALTKSAWKATLNLADNVTKKIEEIWDDFEGLTESIWNATLGLVDNISQGIENVAGDISDLTKSAWKATLDIGGNLVEGIKSLADDISDLVSGKWAINILGNISWPSWSGKGDVESMLSKIFGINFDLPFIKFAAGGNVPGYWNGADGGAGDTVPALLTPGEVVIPRKIVKQHRSLIDAMMTGDLPGYANGGTVYYRSGMPYKNIGGVPHEMHGLKIGGYEVGISTKGVTVNDKNLDQVVKDAGSAAVETTKTVTKYATQAATLGAYDAETGKLSLGNISLENTVEAFSGLAEAIGLTDLTDFVEDKMHDMLKKAVNGMDVIFGDGGGNDNDLFKGNLPALATGTDYIPMTAPYLLHQGERVTPARYTGEQERLLERILTAIEGNGGDVNIRIHADGKEQTYRYTRERLARESRREIVIDARGVGTLSFA